MPVRVEIVTLEIEGGHLLVGNLDPLEIIIGVEFAADGQTAWSWCWR